MHSTDATQPADDPLWYKNAVIYQLHVRAFHDSDGDGIGDFRGLTDTLDYLQDLGVTALWLQPFYPSPLRDDGYDIADYTNIHPDYGTLRDFRRFIREAHKRGLRVITELVLNHTSDQHAWFQKSRQAMEGSPWRDFYVWSDTDDRYADARIIFKDFETSNWSWDPVAGAYYWHRFYSHQPDLNFDNSAVHDALFKVVDFWFNTGVDGMRLDAVPYLYEREGTTCENLPETHDFLKKLRSHVDAHFPNRMLLAEANQWPEDAIAYFGDPETGGDECHMAFHFPVMPRLFMGVRMEDRFPIIDIMQQTPAIPENCQWAVFLRNHDELTLEMVTDEERDYMYRVYAHDRQARINLGIRRRLAPLLNNNRRKIELLNGLLFSLPGTPVIYYGDEIGMGDNVYLGDRNGVRTPMQWSADRNAGFSRANPQKLYLPLINDPEYLFQTVNVEAQQGNLSSMLWWIKRLIALRQRFPVFGHGTLEFLHPENPRVLAFVRENEEQTVLVIANLSRFVQYVELDLSRYRDRQPVELFGMTEFPTVTDGMSIFTLSPHGFYWLALEDHRDESRAVGDNRAAMPTLSVTGDWTNIFQSRARSSLEAALRDWIAPRRWFGGKARKLDSTRITETVRIAGENAEFIIAFVEVSYADAEPDTYQVPLTMLTGERAEILQRDYPHAAIAQVKLKDADDTGVIGDAVYDRGFCKALLEMIRRRRKGRGANGELHGNRASRFMAMLKAAQDELEPHVSRAEQSNSSIIYGQSFIMKLFRKVTEGENPDLEVTRFLTERADCDHTPALAGSLDYQRKRDEPRTLGVLQQYIANEGDAWMYTLNAIGSYFEQVMTQAEHTPPEADDLSLLEMSGTVDGLLTITAEEQRDSASAVPLPAQFISHYLESAALLGTRTAEMHRALASDPDDSAFRAETYTPHQNRSVYQSMRNLTRQSMRMLRQKRRTLPEKVRDDAATILDHESHLLDSFHRILNVGLKGKRIRTHGDYHLGQVLYTGRDFQIIDFEGEPTRPLSERRMKRSPLRDVAGMLRSFDYAACTGMATHRQRFGLSSESELNRLAQWTDFWRQWVCAVYLHAYLDAMSGSGLLPDEDDRFTLMLDSFMLEKALYELDYELNNRPDWITIPVDGIMRLLHEESAE